MKVLVLGELGDLSTNFVVDHLRLKGHEVFRINSEDVISRVHIHFSDQQIKISITCRNTEIDLDTIDRVWYRRGELIFATNVSFSSSVDSEIKRSVRFNLLTEELTTIKEFIEASISHIMPLGGLNERSSNKLIALRKAREAGLLIPGSIISSEKADLLKFHSHNQGDCISKGVQDILTFAVRNKEYFYTTNLIAKSDIEEMNEYFFPSMLQINIAKKYELRVFYLKGKCYTMAIFSQNDQQTKVDFRNYNWDQPNRNVPFNLPEEISEKIDVFMKKMDLQTGSIDLIVTPEQEYVFLEVNPVGQYGMVSIPCSYHLDEKIAQVITKEH